MSKQSETGYALWSIDALRAYEAELYDDEVRGADVWMQRDEILWELNRREFGGDKMNFEAGPQPEPATYTDGFRGMLVVAALALIVLLIASSMPTYGKDWAQNDDYPGINPALIAKFFDEARQPDTKVSCCGRADAYWADDFEIVGGKLVATITDTRNMSDRPYAAPGMRVDIPSNKWPVIDSKDKQIVNPTGHGIVFMQVNNPDSDGKPTVLCYIFPGGT